MKRIFSNGLKVILAVMFSAIAVSCDEDVSIHSTATTLA